jgi:hypothetical protein
MLDEKINETAFFHGQQAKATRRRRNPSYLMPEYGPTTTASIYWLAGYDGHTLAEIKQAHLDYVSGIREERPYSGYSRIGLNNV